MDSKSITQASSLPSAGPIPKRSPTSGKRWPTPTDIYECARKSSPDALTHSAAFRRLSARLAWMFTGRSMPEIAQMVGWSSHSHLSHALRESYRQSHQEDAAPLRHAIREMKARGYTALRACSPDAI